MIKVEHVETWGWEHAIRGMRNPLNSWNRSDSFFCGRDCKECEYKPDYTVNTGCGIEWQPNYGDFVIGKNDLTLMQNLARAGQPHRKYLRQIFVSMDVTAPLYWWKEFDTYKVGTVANGCSTMHKIHSKEFTLEDFSCEHLSADVIENPFVTVIECLNFFRRLYLQDKNKGDWYTVIQLLPSSYNQKRTITLNYENALNMIEYRANHKLDEWCEFTGTLKKLPYMTQISQGGE